MLEALSEYRVILPLSICVIITWILVFWSETRRLFHQVRSDSLRFWRICRIGWVWFIKFCQRIRICFSAEVTGLFTFVWVPIFDLKFSTTKLIGYKFNVFLCWFRGFPVKADQIIFLACLKSFFGFDIKETSFGKHPTAVFIPVLDFGESYLELLSHFLHFFNFRIVVEFKVFFEGT